MAKRTSSLLINMGRINGNYIYKVLCLACMMCIHSSVLAQRWVPYADTARLNKERIGLRERLDFRTNAVDWGLTIPNISVEFTLPNVYHFSNRKPGEHRNVNLKKDSLALIATTASKRTIGLSIKWNWDTSHEISPPQVFNVFDARVEWRQYFRTRKLKSSDLSKNPDLKTRLNQRVFTTKRMNPRMHRAYYWGIYAHGSTYSFKFGKEGKQGSAYGAGLSFGFSTPLYGYSTGYVDFELGGSVGLIYNSYDVFTHDPESNVYAFNPAKSKSGIVPYPVITDLRVAFVYRFMSVANKFQKTATRRKERNDGREQDIKNFLYKMEQDGITNVDSLLSRRDRNIWKNYQKNQEAANKKSARTILRGEAAKALGIVITDTLSKKDEKAIRQKMAEMEKAKKEEAKAAKEAEKNAAKAAEKEAELQKDPEKAKKHAEKEAQKAEKEAEKTKKKAEKEAEKAAKKEKKEKKSKKEKDEDKKDKGAESPEPEKKEDEP